MPSLSLNRLSRYLNTPVANSPLVVFRILFGLIMTAECWGAIFTGWVSDVFIDTPFNFTFIGFEWLQALHGERMYVYYGIMGFLSLCVAAGWRYRLSACLLALLWSGSYFAEKTHYNNHYYLMVLLCWLMVVVPAHHRFSLDAKRLPDIRSNSCARWHRLLFILQVAIVYLFAAIAKLNYDWLHAMPLKLWLPSSANIPLIGPWLAKENTAWFISYTGLFFDLTIVPLMLWRRTRLFGLILSVLFHIGNSIIFQIGTFPYLALALLVFFYPPAFFNRFLPKANPDHVHITKPGHARWATVVLSCYLLWQAFLPLRHWLFEGDVAWTEEGHRMAWRMMLRSKHGYVTFRLRDNSTGVVWQESAYQHLPAEQAGDVGTHPDVCWQYVQFLKDSCRGAGMPGVSIKAIGYASVNGGKQYPLFDSTVDLAAERWRGFEHHRWVTGRP